MWCIPQVAAQRYCMNYISQTMRRKIKSKKIKSRKIKSRKLKHRLFLGFGLVATALLMACSADKMALTCEREGFTEAEPANIAVNIYVDGTPSMQGFSSAANGKYAKAIDVLRTMMTLDEPVTLAGKTGSFARSPQYFRLGKSASTGAPYQEISEADYREAQFSDFYSGGSTKFPALAVTELDAAIKPIDEGDGLTVIISDLYQGQDDIKTVTKALKDTLNQSPDQVVGLVGVRSEFNGTIYTEALRNNSSFSHKGLHPFYVLFVGRLDDVHFYVNKLVEALGTGDNTNAVIFSASRFYQQPIVLARKSQSELFAMGLPPAVAKQVSIPAKAMKSGQTTVTFEDESIQPLLFGVASRGTIAFPGSASLNPIEYVLPIAGVEATVTTGSSFGPDPFVEDSGEAIYSLSDATIESSSLTFTSQFDRANISDELYFVQAALRPAGGLQTQAWWSGWNAASTENDGTKTHNLEEFAKQLRSITISRLDQNSPEVGKLCYVVQER
jgi:hypothetical protein